MMSGIDLRKSAWSAIVEAWSKWRHRNAAAAELAQCSQSDLRRIAHDLGLSVSELRVISGANSRDVLFARLRAAGIDQENVDPAVLRDLLACCAACDYGAACERELNERPVPAKWPSHCPNELTIGALMTMKCH